MGHWHTISNLNGRQEVKTETPKRIPCLDTIKLVEFGDFWISRWETLFFMCIKFCSDSNNNVLTCKTMGYWIIFSVIRKRGCLWMTIFWISGSSMVKYYIHRRAKGRRKHYQLLRSVFLIYGGCLKSIDIFTAANKFLKKTKKPKRQSFCQICVSKADN